MSPEIERFMLNFDESDRYDLPNESDYDYFECELCCGTFREKLDENYRFCARCEEYNRELQGRIIYDWAVDCFISPYTKIGKKRLDKEYDNLIIF